MAALEIRNQKWVIFISNWVIFIWVNGSISGWIFEKVTPGDLPVFTRTTM